MKKILEVFLSSLFYLGLGLLLVIFHPVQVICYNLGGYKSHKRAVEILNYLILKEFAILGCSLNFKGFEILPKGRPLIIISNHQSTWDISPVVWGFRDFHTKFVSKISLSKGIPSISYNLRKSGAALIDRKNAQQAVKELIRLGRYIEQNNYSACIFPEGTRSRDGRVRKFRSTGIKTLLKEAPSALLVPFAIDGNWNLEKNGAFPMSIGHKLTYTVLEPVDPAGKDIDLLIDEIENRIKRHLGQAD
ncbi:MAG: lysophospholipid acyltransferase family protein [Bacteroidales bacterium]